MAAKNIAAVLRQLGKDVEAQAIYERIIKPLLTVVRDAIRPESQSIRLRRRQERNRIFFN